MLAPFDLLGTSWHPRPPNFQGQLTSKDLKRVLRDLGEELDTVDFASFMKMLPAITSLGLALDGGLGGQGVEGGVGFNWDFNLGPRKLVDK